jgi:hypothetical protein
MTTHFIAAEIDLQENPLQLQQAIALQQTITSKRKLGNA